MPMLSGLITLLLFSGLDSAQSQCPTITLVDDARAIEPDTVVSVLAISPDFEISVQIMPTSQSPVSDNYNFESIFDIYSTDEFCCNYGDRILDVKFYPDSTSLQIWVDSLNSNDHCGGFSSSSLPLNIWSTLQVSVDGSQAQFFVDGSLVDVCTLGTRLYQEAANVAIGNLGTYYYQPAQAQIKNLTYRSLENQGSCWSCPDGKFISSTGMSQWEDTSAYELYFSSTI